MRILRKRNSGVSERSSIFEYLSKQAVGTDSLVLSESLVPPTVAKEAPKVADKNNKVKKRKLDLAVEGHYHKVTLTADISGSSSSSNSGTGAINSFEGVTGEGWQCDYCGKVLATEQVLRLLNIIVDVNVVKLMSRASRLMCMLM